MELHARSAGVSVEEQIFYTEDNDETEEHIWERKKAARAPPTNQIADDSIGIFVTYESDYHKLSAIQKLSNTISLAIEQNDGILLQQLRHKILEEDYSETILLQDTRYHHYCPQLDRLSVTDEIFTRL